MNTNAHVTRQMQERKVEALRFMVVSPHTMQPRTHWDRDRFGNQAVGLFPGSADWRRLNGALRLLLADRLVDLDERRGMALWSLTEAGKAVLAKLPEAGK
ncbi:MAG TPA: hypothetical protein VFB71_12310 [Ramlibacter sp.]|nr:hypothetical protein [Ramlibacter sp.]